MNRKTLLWIAADAAALALLAALIYTIYQQVRQPPEKARQLPPVVGAIVPNVELTDLDGTPRALEDFRGRGVVINFWATWCPPCKEEMPALQKYAEKHPDQLVVLGIDVEEPADLVRAFVGQNKITYPILLDQDGAAADRFFVKDYPTSFFVDNQGKLRVLHTGLLTEADLVKYLKMIGINEP